MWLIKSEQESLNKLHSRIVKGISTKCPKHDPTYFEFKVHCLFPHGNWQYLPLGALNVHKNYGIFKNSLKPDESLAVR